MAGDLTREAEKMIAELDALVMAWVDRGAHPSLVGQVLTGRGHGILRELGTSLGELIQVLTEAWHRRGGKP